LSCSGRAKNQRGGECGEGELGGWGIVKQTKYYANLISSHNLYSSRLLHQFSCFYATFVLLRVGRGAFCFWGMGGDV
jgi:hypothetical protein